MMGDFVFSLGKAYMREKIEAVLDKLKEEAMEREGEFFEGMMYVIRRIEGEVKRL